MSVPVATVSSFEQLRHNYGKKVARFLVVSGFNVVFGQGLLVVAHTWFGWSFAVSNGFAVAVSAGPAYVLARYWVWGNARRIISSRKCFRSGDSPSSVS